MASVIEINSVKELGLLIKQFAPYSRANWRSRGAVDVVKIIIGT